MIKTIDSYDLTSALPLMMHLHHGKV